MTTPLEWIMLAGFVFVIGELDGLRRGFAHAMERLVLSVEEIQAQIESQKREIPLDE